LREEGGPEVGGTQEAPVKTLTGPADSFEVAGNADAGAGAGVGAGAGSEAEEELDYVELKPAVFKLVFFSMAMSCFMVGLDLTIVVTAIPAIARQYSADVRRSGALAVLEHPRKLLTRTRLLAFLICRTLSHG
jgi:hypothetical protein